MFNSDSLFTLYKALHLISINPQSKSRFSAQTACEQLMKFLNKSLTAREDLLRLRDRINLLWEMDNQINLNRVALRELFSMLLSNEINEVSQEVIDELVDRLQIIKSEQRFLLESVSNLFVKIVDLNKEAQSHLEAKQHHEVLEKTIDILSLVSIISSDYSRVYGKELLGILRNVFNHLHELLTFFLETADVSNARLAYEVFIEKVITLLVKFQGGVTAEQEKIRNGDVLKISICLLSHATVFLKQGAWSRMHDCCETIVDNFYDIAPELSEDDNQRFQAVLAQFAETFITELLNYFSKAAQLITKGEVIDSAKNRDEALLMCCSIAGQLDIQLTARVNEAIKLYRNACVDRYSQISINQNELDQFLESFKTLDEDRAKFLDFPAAVFSRILTLESEAVSMEERNYHEVFNKFRMMISLIRILPSDCLVASHETMAQLLQRSMLYTIRLLDYFIKGSIPSGAILAFHSLYEFILVKESYGRKDTEDSQILLKWHEAVTTGFVSKACDLLEADKVDAACEFHHKTITYLSWKLPISVLSDNSHLKLAFKKFNEIFLTKYCEKLDKASELIAIGKADEAKPYVEIAFSRMTDYAKKSNVALDGPLFHFTLDKFRKTAIQRRNDISAGTANSDAESSYNEITQRQSGAQVLQSPLAARSSSAMFSESVRLSLQPEEERKEVSSRHNLAQQ